MRQSLSSAVKALRFVLSAAIFLISSENLFAQEITVYQFRHVDPDKADEFVKRETTYWSKVARKAIDKGALSFWALFERVEGSDVQNAPNYLFVNTYPNLDSNAGNIWDPTALFPKIPVSQIQTNSISKVTGQYFLQGQGWQQSSKAMPDKDFQYIIMVYHNSTDPSGFIDMENRQWAPFIKTAMDNQQTKQVAWGNAVVLAPSGPDVKFNSVSYDLFPSLKAALLQDWNPNTKFPTAGLDSLNKISVGMPGRELYRIVKVEAKQ